MDIFISLIKQCLQLLFHYAFHFSRFPEEAFKNGILLATMKSRLTKPSCPVRTFLCAKGCINLRSSYGNV